MQKKSLVVLLLDVVCDFLLLEEFFDLGDDCFLRGDGTENFVFPHGVEVDCDATAFAKMDADVFPAVLSSLLEPESLSFAVHVAVCDPVVVDEFLASSEDCGGVFDEILEMVHSVGPLLIHV